MKTLTDNLTHYAAFHRDTRNIATHFVGVPMIVVAIAILLARPSFEWLGVAWSPASLLVLGTLVFYFRMDLTFGLVFVFIYGATWWLAQSLAAQSTTLWLSWGVGLFVVGWAIQFVGHFWEGKKPAFVDDIAGLFVGPLFVAAEVGFMLGLRKPLEQAIVARVGPTRSGPLPT